MTRIPAHFGFSIVITTFVLGTAVIPATAGSITYTTNVDTVSQPGSIPQFDANLGVLTSVEFKLSLTAYSTFSVVPDISGGTYILPVSFDFIAGTSDFFAEFANSFNFGLGSSQSAFQLTDSFDYSASLAADPVFTGNGQLSLQIGYGFGSPSITSPPLDFQEFVVGFPDSYMTGQATVTYEYGAIPEPRSFVMGGTACVAWLGFAIGRRWRRSL
jgi:hypothetical protein